MLGDNNSILGVTSNQLDRKFTYGASAWWMPTTKEFGPKGAYGDWEYHETVATRFGFSSTWSPEQRFTDTTGGPDNTSLRLADSLNVFETGALAPGVTVDRVDYKILSLDAGIKHKGVFLQTEVYNRWFGNFKADGALPVTSIHDTGFYVQGAFYPVPKKLELYGATSQIFGDKGAGFSNSSEYLAGMNFYLTDTRNHRFNVQVIDVNDSPSAARSATTSAARTALRWRRRSRSISERQGDWAGACPGDRSHANLPPSAGSYGFPRALRP
jgi:hypothetical protein